MIPNGSGRCEAFRTVAATSEPERGTNLHFVLSTIQRCALLRIRGTSNWPSRPSFPCAIFRCNLHTFADHLPFDATSPLPLGLLPGLGKLHRKLSGSPNPTLISFLFFPFALFFHFGFRNLYFDFLGLGCFEPLVCCGGTSSVITYSFATCANAAPLGTILPCVSSWRSLPVW